MSGSMHSALQSEFRCRMLYTRPSTGVLISSPDQRKLERDVSALVSCFHGRVGVAERLLQDLFGSSRAGET